MRIISKFKDYYDSAASYGVDLECIYERDTKIVELPRIKGNHSFNNYPRFSRNYDSYSSDKTSIVSTVGKLLGFCGKIYPLIQVNLISKTLYFYSFEKYYNFLQENNLLNYLKRRPLFNLETDYYNTNCEKSLKDLFNTNFENKLNHFFVKEHTPVFLYENDKITINPNLKELNFNSEKDPATCFQEIFMYLSGVLGNKEKEIVNIDNKYKILQHGFDKFSFRKLPKKKV